MTGLRLALATFDNVFDTVPNRRVVDLDTLVDGLSRFELRDDAATKTARRIARIRTAWDTIQRVGHAPGKEASALLHAAKEADGRGEDRHAAMQARLERLLHEAHHDAKRLIALWSPACFRDGGRRTGDDVLHLSCLCFDYDTGVSLDQVLTHWAGRFLLVHSTWSHTATSPRLRAVLPFARPVDATGWDAVWAWGASRANHTVDAAPKGRASTFALPAVPSPDAPRLAHLQPGELLDPVALGLADEAAPPGPVAWSTPHHFDGGRPKKQQLRCAVDAGEPTSVGAPPEDDVDFDAFG